MSRFFTSGGQSIGASASASILPMNIQGWFPLGWTGLISLLSKGLSRVFPSTRVWKRQFFGSQPSFWSSFHIRTWLLEKPLTRWIFVGKVMSLLFNMLSRLVIAFLPRSNKEIKICHYRKSSNHKQNSKQERNKWIKKKIRKQLTKWQ